MERPFPEGGPRWLGSSRSHPGAQHQPGTSLRPYCVGPRAARRGATGRAPTFQAALHDVRHRAIGLHGLPDQQHPISIHLPDVRAWRRGGALCRAQGWQTEGGSPRLPNAAWSPCLPSCTCCWVPEPTMPWTPSFRVPFQRQLVERPGASSGGGLGRCLPCQAPPPPMYISNPTEWPPLTPLRQLQAPIGGACPGYAASPGSLEGQLVVGHWWESS